MKPTLIRLDRIDSTNAYCLREAAQLAAGTVVVADAQTAGRGRFRRTWVSPPGVNLYVSILIKPPWIQAEPHLLSLAAAVAIRDTAAAQGVTRAWVKWPNDVCVGDNKLAGILAEGATSTAGEILVVGMGVNLNMTPRQLRDIDRPATSVAVETGRAADRDAFLRTLLAQWRELADQMARGGFAAIHARWVAGDRLRGRRLCLRQGERAWTGRAVRLGRDGSLVIRLADGREQAFNAGEVTVAERSDGRRA